MTKRWTHKTAITLIAMTAITLPAAASAWQIWDGQSEEAPRAIFASGSSSSSTLITCDGKGQMAARITLDTTDIVSQMKKNTPYSREESAVMTVGERPSVETDMRYIPAIKTLETRRHSIAAKLFNSAIRGESLTFDLETAGTLDMQLPEPDAAFKAFAKTCQASRTES